MDTSAFTFTTMLKVVAGFSAGMWGLGWLIGNVPGGALDRSSKRNAEDYNSFTDDMEALIAKYGKLEHYETQYYDNRMDVSFAFRPHDPYFDQVELDAENWGGDPDGPLAQALAKARAAVRKPLKITKLPHPNQKSLKDFEADDFGDMEYILLVMLTDEQLEEEYGDFMRDEGVGRKELPQRLQDRYRTGEEAEYLREKYLEPEGPECESCSDTEGKGKTDKYGYFCNTCREEYPEDFEADEWKLLPRDALGRWQKPVDSESIYQLRETLSSDVPDISDLLTMYGGDTPSNRFRLYRDLQQLSLDQMDAALPDDSQVSFDEADMTWMTPEEYFQYILEEEINVPEGENEESSLEFQDRLVRYTAATMSPTEIQELIADNMEEITKDLFVDREEAEGEIQYLKAVLRYQNFASKWQAETTQFKCDLCGIILSGSNRHVAGVGHYIDNYNSKGGYCCDQCNFTVVLPARTRGEHL